MKFLESRGDDNLAETAQLVSAEPDVTVVERNAAADQFICLACDGIFDVFLNEELADYINSQLKVRGDDLEQLCSDVIDTSLHKVRSAPILNQTKGPFNNIFRDHVIICQLSYLYSQQRQN